MRRPITPQSLILVLLACLLVPSPSAAQEVKPTEQTRTREAFGSSLKRAPVAGKEGAQSEDAEPSPAETIRVETLLVNMDVVVTDLDESRFITGLRAEDFAVFEDGAEQRITSLTSGDDAGRLPRSIVLVFDWSGSQLAYLEESVKAAKTLVGKLAPEDRMAIVTDSVYLMTDFTNDRKRLKSALDSLLKQTRGGWRGRSKQFSALLATLRELINDKTRRPIVIFQTDGDEAGNLKDPPGARNTSPGSYYMSDIYREVEMSRVKIYTVIPGERLFGLPQEEAEARSRRLTERQMETWYKFNRQAERPERRPEVGEPIMKMLTAMQVRNQEAAARVAEVSGGWTEFLDSPERAAAIYGRILADINNHYVIGYYPTNKERDGRLRKVRVEVRGHPDYKVHGRQSYYAVAR